MDFYFSTDGDIKLSPVGDIAVTETQWRDDGQQVYVRMKTEPGDWTLYPNLGIDLQVLYGMPQSKQTGDFGRKLIEKSLLKDPKFVGRQINVVAIPSGPQTIRFDIYVKSGSKEQLALSVEQDLGVL